MLQSIFYDWNDHLKPFSLGGASNIFSHRVYHSPNELIIQIMTTVFVEHPLASPGFANPNEHEHQQCSGMAVLLGRELSVLRTLLWL